MSFARQNDASAGRPVAALGGGASVRRASLALAVAAALFPAAAEAYTFTTINDPADPPFNGVTFTNLMGINSSGLIAGFYGSGQAGDPNTGFLLTLPNTFTLDNFPGNPQTQITALNDTGTFTGYTYPTNDGVPVDSSSASTKREASSPRSTIRRPPTAMSRAPATPA